MENSSPNKIQLEAVYPILNKSVSYSLDSPWSQQRAERELHTQEMFEWRGMHLNWGLLEKSTSTSEL